MRIREFQSGDELPLFGIYYSAVHQIACRDYTQEQINAWAPKNLDQMLWASKIQAIKPFIAELGAEIVGYADLQDNGYIDHFFVSGAHPRIGVGRALMEKIHDKAARLGLQELSADVSRTAQPFFAHFGFVIVEQRRPVVRGVEVPNAFMQKCLKDT